MIYNCPKCGLSKSDSAMGSILPQCKCDWNSKLLQLQHYNCNGMPAYEGSLSKDQLLAQPNNFNPDWDAMAVMVEEQQRMAKRIEELENRLAQPEQEPVAWVYSITGALFDICPPDADEGEFLPLYTVPPQREKLDAVNDLLRVQGIDGNWNYDPYMQGMYNGMEVVISILEDREPIFKEAPDEWLHGHKDTIAWNEMKESIE